MADAYLRFTVNGNRHSCLGDGRSYCKNMFSQLRRLVEKGLIHSRDWDESHRLLALESGDIVSIDLVRRKRKNRRFGNTQLGTVTFKIKEIKRNPLEFWKGFIVIEKYKYGEV